MEANLHKKRGILSLSRSGEKDSCDAWLNSDLSALVRKWDIKQTITQVIHFRPEIGQPIFWAIPRRVSAAIKSYRISKRWIGSQEGRESPCVVHVWV